MKKGVVCVGVYVHICVAVKVQPQDTIAYETQSAMYFEARSLIGLKLITRLGCQASKTGDPPVPASLVPGITRTPCCLAPVFLCVLWGSKLRPSCLQGEPFNGHAPPDPTLFKTPFLPMLSWAVLIVFALPVDEFTLVTSQAAMVEEAVLSKS